MHRSRFHFQPFFYWTFPWLEHLEIKVMRRGSWLQYYNIHSHSKLMLQCFNQHEDQFHNWGHTQSCFFISFPPSNSWCLFHWWIKGWFLLSFFSSPRSLGDPKTVLLSAIIKDVAVCLFLFGGVRRLPVGNTRETARDKTSRKSRLTLYWRSVSDWRLRLITLIWFYTSILGLLTLTLEKNCGLT